MARMIPPKGMMSLSVTTHSGQKVLNASKDGTFKVDNPKLIKALQAEGLGVAGIDPVTRNQFRGGFDCKKCGFGSFFKVCSRCGEDNG